MGIVTTALLRGGNNDDATGDLSPLSANRSALAQAHERDKQETVTEAQVASWDEGLALTQEWMREGVAVIQRPFLEVTLESGDVLRGRPDRIVRQMGGAYQPVLITADASPTAADEVQLDAYCALVGANYGQFWAGDPVRRVRHQFDAQRLQAAVAQVGAQ